MKTWAAIVVCMSCDSGRPAFSKDDLRAMRREFAAKIDHDIGGDKGAARTAGPNDDILDVNITDCDMSTLAMFAKSDVVMREFKQLEFSALACRGTKYKLVGPWD